MDMEDSKPSSMQVHGFAATAGRKWRDLTSIVDAESSLSADRGLLAIGVFETVDSVSL